MSHVSSTTVYTSRIYYYFSFPYQYSKQNTIAFSLSTNLVGGRSLTKRVHHHAANYERDSIDKTEDMIHDDYQADFRWPDSYFDVEASSDVAVVVGQTAFLVCRVAVAGNWTVSHDHAPFDVFHFLLLVPFSLFCLGQVFKFCPLYYNIDR